MFCFRVLLIGFALLVTALAPSAEAQYQGAEGAGAESGDSAEATVANLGVRISQLQEQIRALEGKIEQISFENKQLKAQLDKSGSDIQYRLAALEKSKTAAPPPSSPDTTPPDSSQLQPVENTSSGEPAATSKFATARDLYNHALGLLNHEAKYAEAGTEFASFTQQYPHDPLIGNAYYWLGETQYVRRDYIKAADSFRQGYEAMPTGPKASENLLKLAMSLDALNKDKEACVVLKQVVTKFGHTSSSIRQRSEQEINRIGCN